MKRLAMALLMLAATTASAAERKENWSERLPVTEGDRVVVDVESIDVFLRTGDVRDVEVTTELRIAGVNQEKADAWIEKHTPEIERSDDGVVVRARPGRSGGFALWLLTARSRVGLITPASTVPDITTTSGRILIHGDFPDADPLMIRSSTGDMELVGAASGVDVRSSSGSARIRVVRPLDTLFARTSSGNVTLEGGARSVHVDTTSGDVWMTNLSGPAEAVTTTGGITLRWDRLDADAEVSVKTSSGRIQIVLPEHVSPKGLLKTTTGTIRSDLPGTVSEAGDAVELAGDGPRLTVETDSGEIILSRVEGWAARMEPVQ